MVRPKAFSPDQVIEKAMYVFWEKGYTATSMNDLVEAMGIHRGSLYNTFGDKQALFRAAIAHYNRTVVTQAIAHLQSPNASKQAIVDTFYEFAHQAANDPFQRGCFLTNTAVEFGGQDPDFAKQLTLDLQHIEDALYSALVRAQQRQELAADKQPRAIAHYLITCLLGIRVVSKVNPDLDALTATINIALSSLE